VAPAAGGCGRPACAACLPAPPCPWRAQRGGAATAGKCDGAAAAAAAPAARTGRLAATPPPACALAARPAASCFAALAARSRAVPRSFAGGAAPALPPGGAAGAPPLESSFACSRRSASGLPRVRRAGAAGAARAPPPGLPGAGAGRASCDARAAGRRAAPAAAGSGASLAAAGPLLGARRGREGVRRAAAAASACAAARCAAAGAVLQSCVRQGPRCQLMMRARGRRSLWQTALCCDAIMLQRRCASPSPGSAHLRRATPAPARKECARQRHVPQLVLARRHWLLGAAPAGAGGRGRQCWAVWISTNYILPSNISTICVEPSGQQCSLVIQFCQPRSRTRNGREALLLAAKNYIVQGKSTCFGLCSTAKQVSSLHRSTCQLLLSTQLKPQPLSEGSHVPAMLAAGARSVLRRCLASNAQPAGAFDLYSCLQGTYEHICLKAHNQP